VRSLRSPFRSLVLGALAVVLLAVMLGARPAAAFEIAAGWDVNGATVTGPDGEQTQTWDGEQAAAYVQSFLFASMYGSLREDQPPPNTPRTTVEVTHTVNGVPGHVVSYYVTDGATAWVGLPEQMIGPGAFVPEEKWFVAPELTTQAFQGQAEPIDPAATSETTAPPSEPADTAAPSPAEESSDDSSAWPIVLGVALAVLVVGGAVALVLVRRRSPATTPPSQRRSSEKTPVG
jgi:hypothetical protein